MIAWAIETFVATTLLMLLVLAIRTPVRRAFGPNMAYALWLLPVARMVLPPLPEGWRNHGVAPLADASQQMIYYVVEPLADTPAVYLTGEGVPWALILLTSWAIGAVGFVTYHWISHSRFCAAIRKRARSTGRVADGKVEVIESDAAAGPLAFGIIRKTVAFPRDFAERYDDTERDLALAHELGHHARGDLIANWVALVMLGLHWFNPVAWKAFRAFRADQEMACDALVLAGREASLRHAYGRAIVKSAHGGAVSAACHLHTINDLKGRLKMLLDNQKRSRGRVFGGGAATMALGLAALGLTASGTQAAETIKTSVEERIGVKFDDVTLPSFLPAAEASMAEQVTPPETAAPPAPQAAPASPAAPESLETRTETRTITVRRRDNGEPIIVHSAVNIPELIERNCGESSTNQREMVLEEKDGEKRRMVICTDRIELMAKLAADKGAQATLFAMSSAKMGTSVARMSLGSARRAIETQTELTAEQRTQALAGIDQAMAELDSQKDN